MNSPLLVKLSIQSPLMPENVVLQLHRVSYRYPKQNRFLFQNLDLQVFRGECIALIGPSGSGKSTLLKLLGGLLQPESGSIDSTSSVVSWVFQDGRFIPWLTVAENFLLGVTGLSFLKMFFFLSSLFLRNAHSSLASELPSMEDLRAFALPPDVLSRFPHELSGGERMRLALLRAFLRGPQLLFLDEPFGSLDPDIARQLRELLKKKFSNATWILVTHSLQEALDLSHRIWMLNSQGEISVLSTPSQTLDGLMEQFSRLREVGAVSERV